MQNKLYRSNVDIKIAGVCGGYGEYFRIDPTFLRIAAVLLIFADGIGVIAYIISWIAMPKRPLAFDDTGVPLRQETPEGEVTYSSSGKYLPGLILVAIGAVFLVNNLWWWFDFGDLWPILLIAVGVFLLFRMNGRSENEQKQSNPEEAHHDAR